MSGEDLQPGTLVADQYEIERLIGSGGFARVYRARQLELDRPVALKVLAPRRENESGSTLETVKKRFYREARLISQLRAPHTVTVYEYDVLDDGKLYMALEYIDGTDLDSLIEEEAPLAPRRIIRILTQVLKALGAAHNQDILHRDIKPTNVMVFERFGETDCVKLLDFGIAKSVMAENQLEGGLTMEGAVIGTPRYMSPEQLQGRPLTPASDLFSAGLLVYEMFTGESPFETHDINAIFGRMKRMPEDLGPLEEAPAPLLPVARKLLTVSIDERYDSAADALEDLRESPTAPNQTEPPEVLDDVTTGESTTEPVDSPTHAADESDAISFPLGLDRAGATPSTELTSVSAGGQTTVAMTSSSTQPPSTPEWNTSAETDAVTTNPQPVRESAPGARPKSPSADGPEPPSNDASASRSTDLPTGQTQDGNQTGVTPGGLSDRPPRNSRPQTDHATPKMPDDSARDSGAGERSWGSIGASILGGLALVVGLWFAFGTDGNDTSPPDSDQSDQGAMVFDDENAPEPNEEESSKPRPPEVRSARKRASRHLRGALLDARRRSDQAAAELESDPPREDEKTTTEPDRRRPDPEPAPDPSPSSDRPNRDRDTPSPFPDETSDDSEDSAPAADDETNEDSQAPGFKVEPLE